MADYLLKMDRKDNPEYYSVIDGHNEIMDEWNRIMKVIHEFTFPRYFPFFQKRRLNPTRIELQKLQSKFIEWNKKAYSIIKDPQLSFPSSDDSLTTFLHVTALLRDIRNKLGFDMEMIRDGFNHRCDSIDVQINFVVAIISVVLSLIGLILSLCPRC